MVVTFFPIIWFPGTPPPWCKYVYIYYEDLSHLRHLSGSNSSTCPSAERWMGGWPPNDRLMEMNGGLWGLDVICMYIILSNIYLYIYMILKGFNWFNHQLEGSYDVLASKFCSEPWIVPAKYATFLWKSACVLVECQKDPSPLTLKSHFCRTSAAALRTATTPYARNWKSRLRRIWKRWAASLRRLWFHGFIGFNRWVKN